MRRIILAACLLFGAAGELLAATVHLYADNRRACTGMATTGGGTTTLPIASFANIDTTIFTDQGVAGAGGNDDVISMGLYFTGGTSAPAITTAHKITAVASNADPAHPSYTVSPSMGTTPAADWTFVIFYGSNANTGASQTKGTGSTGPVLDINFALLSSALSAADLGHVHVRGNTGQSYVTTYGSLSGLGLIYNASVGSTKTFIIEGYVTTAIPSDLAALAVKTSTYTTPSVSNPAASVLVSAGAALYADTATVALLPKLRYASANQAVGIGDPAATSPSLTLRYLDVQNASTSGSSSVVSLANTTTLPTLVIESCVIGSLATTDDNAYSVNQGTTGVAPTNSITLSKCVLLNRRSGVNATTLQRLTVDQCYIENYGKDKDGSSVNGLSSVRSDNASAATYSAAMVPTNQVLQLVCADNNIVHTATHSAASTTCIGIQANKSVEMEICRIKGNYLKLYSKSSGIGIIGAPSFDVQDNRIELDNATVHGVGIAVGADATVEANPTGNTYLLVASGTNDANGSQVAADGGTPLALPAHSLFKLTGGSATNDAYKGMLIETNTGTGLRTSVCWAYDGTTKIAKCTPQFGSAIASGAEWKAYKLRYQGHGIIAHNLLNSVQLPATTSHAFGLFQGCDHLDFYDNTAFGYFDNGIVLKGEYCRVTNNRICGGVGCLLVKGGSFNLISNNTFYQNLGIVGGGCFALNDKSNVYNMASGEVPLQGNHWSKACGNRIVNNIFINAANVNAGIIDDASIGAGSWSGAASAYSFGNGNLIDYNAYSQLHATAKLGNLNGSDIAHGASIATLQAAWTAYTTAVQYGATNDAHSSIDAIQLKNPMAGDFTVVGGPAASVRGSDGNLIGASRPSGGRNPFILAN